MEFQAVLDAVRALPTDDQVRLVDMIQDDLLADSDVPELTPAQVKEIERRLTEYDANPSVAIPWEKFEAHFDERREELGE